VEYAIFYANTEHLQLHLVYNIVNYPQSTGFTLWSWSENIFSFDGLQLFNAFIV